MFKTVSTRHGAAERADACANGCSQVESYSNYDAYPKTDAGVLNAEIDRWEHIFWQGMKNRGIFLMVNQLESQLVFYTHTDEDIEETLETYKVAL